MLCIIITFAGFLISVLLAFVLDAIDNIKKNPVAMAKLKGTKA
jgi:ABC-type phosphate/phosphonate transport system permease subunit